MKRDIWNLPAGGKKKCKESNTTTFSVLSLSELLRSGGFNAPD